MKKLFANIAIFLSMLILSPVYFTSAYGAASVNVSLERDIYDDMELWAAEGLIGSQLNSFKPFAASEVGQQLVAAMDACHAAKTARASCRKIREHYATLFNADFTEAKSPRQTNHTYFKPVESFSVNYKYFSGPFSVYNNEGIDYGKGHNAAVQLQSHARLWNVFSFFIEPAFIYNQQFGSGEDQSRLTFRLHKGYAKFNLYNVELLVGRDALWWGPGYHGALLMSNNAHPFDMVKLSNPEPVLLPWIFSRLGPVQFNLIFSQLNDQRKGSELANPFLYGLRLGLKPHPFVEVGGSHLVLFGGPGRRDMTLREILATLYSNSNRDNEKTDSNQQFAVDLAITIPNIQKYIFIANGIRLYGEIGAEDSGYPPDTRAYLAGLAIYKPFFLDGSVLRAEYAILSPDRAPGAWYHHGSYPLRYEGRVFGHHAGADAEDIFVEWSHDLDKFFYKVGFDRERSGIKTQAHSQSKNQYFGEVGWSINKHSKMILRYTYEDVQNAGSIPGVKLQNHYVGIEVSLQF